MNNRRTAIPLAFGIILIFLSKCAAGEITEASLVEDKPACVEETRFISVGDGSNVLKTSFFHFATTITNAFGQVINKVELPKRFPGHLSPTNIFAVPSGKSILLNPPENSGDDLSDFSHPTISRLSLYHIPRTQTATNTPRQRPNIYLGSPPDGDIVQPLIEISGASDQPMTGVTYDVLNSSKQLTNQYGLITDAFFDEQKFEFTTNYFDCTDINLSPGTNLLMIHCHYPSGSVATLKKQYVLRLDLKTNAPQFTVTWPHPEREISGSNISIRGELDDISDNVTAEMDIGGRKHRINGLVERSGRFWLDDVPLVSKTNAIKIMVTDVVGNSSSTNLMIIKSDDKLSIKPVPVDQLWQMQVTVSGTVSPPDRNVTVNGITAKVEPNGDWSVKGIELSREGVAVLEAVASPLAKKPDQENPQNFAGNLEVHPVENTSLVATYSQTNLILNASQPTYGTFKIHLTGTAGQMFVLQASPNLIDWSPIMTNLDNNASFDYEDTNVVKYGCRFFRVVPMQ